jgi:hypothetical protein
LNPSKLFLQKTDLILNLGGPFKNLQLSFPPSVVLPQLLECLLLGLERGLHGRHRALHHGIIRVQLQQLHALHEKPVLVVHGGIPEEHSRGILRQDSHGIIDLELVMVEDLLEVVAFVGDDAVGFGFEFVA